MIEFHRRIIIYILYCFKNAVIFEIELKSHADRYTYLLLSFDGTYSAVLEILTNTNKNYIHKI